MSNRADIANEELRADFLDVAGEKIGEFKGMISTDGNGMTGYGSGSYTPPRTGYVRIVIYDRAEGVLRRADIRGQNITFTATRV